MTSKIEFPLNCLFLGETSFLDVFTLTIRKINKIDDFEVDYDDLQISHLKHHIYRTYCETTHETKFYSGNINLWKVNIAENEEYRLKVVKEEDIENMLGGVKLRPNRMFESYFPTIPEKTNIHIIVHVPNKTLSRQGGLGGTTYQGLERGHFYEGVDLNSVTICKREPTIKKLLECLLNEHIILIRSPPMTGKTALSQLFENSLLKLDEVRDGSAHVFRISLLWMENFTRPWTFSEEFESLMGMSWDNFLDQCDYKKVYLIIDEVQKIYGLEDREPLHGGNVFWSAFERIMQNSKLFIVALASCEHYGAYANDSTANILTMKNKWGYKDICFTKEEFHDYFYKLCKVHLNNRLIKDDIPDFFRYESDITAYHPGLVACTMNYIVEKCNEKNNYFLYFSEIFSYLKSPDFDDLLKCTRTFYPPTYLLDDERKIVDSVLFRKGGLPYNLEKIEYDSRLLITNVLVDTSSSQSHIALLDFPAPLLRVTYLQDRLGQICKSKLPPCKFDEFIKLVFTKMNPKILQKCEGRGADDSHLLERVWQMEFYRASIQVLTKGTYASVDVGTCFGSNGYIDFYINDKREWAVELLSDSQFEVKGRDIPILKSAKKWALIDIRKMQVPKPEIGSYDIYVSCAENFKSAQLIYPNGTEEIVRLLGEEDDLLGYDISTFLEEK